jgi:hypothetical protein
MREPEGRRLGLLVGLALALTSGCGAPDSWLNPPPEGPAAKGPPPGPVEGPGFNPGARPGPHGPGAPGPLNLAGGHEDMGPSQAAYLAQKLGQMEDERKVLMARTQQLEISLDERERALFETRNEVQAATDEVSRTFQDLQRLKQENANLRERLRLSEKESMQTLQSIVDLLKKMAEGEKPPPKPRDEGEPKDQTREPGKEK